MEYINLKNTNKDLWNYFSPSPLFKMVKKLSTTMSKIQSFIKRRILGKLTVYQKWTIYIPREIFKVLEGYTSSVN